MKLGHAAEILGHYIRLALEQSGRPIDPEAASELQQAIEAFHDAEEKLDADG
jgi:hypothetical protein